MTPDDPRLTAHALGETDGPLTPEERAEVDALRATAETLKAGFAAVPMPSLDPARRAAILGEAAPAPVLPFSSHAGVGALAAMLLLVVGFTIAGATGGVEIGAQKDVAVVHFETAPNNSGTYLDDSLALATADLGSTDATARFAAPNRILKPGGTGMTLGGGGGGGGHQYPAPGFTLPLKAGGSGGPGGGKGGDFYMGQDFDTVVSGGVRQGLTESNSLLRSFHSPVNVRLGEVTNGLDDVTSLGYVGGTGGSTATWEQHPAFGTSEKSEYEFSSESFAPLVENAWIRPFGESALSTFSIDVDTAAYAIVRRCLLEQGRLPPPGALRLEELVNYFPYAYGGPSSGDPFAVHVDAASCPWEPRHRLVRIALKGREVEEAMRPAANLVFLLDVSGSMAQPNKLPLVKQSIALLADRLTVRDRVAMVVYAGSEGLALPSTQGGDHEAIKAAIGRLEAGGSTNGGAGITLAYKVATENFIPGGINRVVLATDGDFNVGISDPSSLVKMVEEKAKSGVFLTALGYGMDNLKDSTLEQLADKGNGNYGYVDSLREAEKVLVTEGMSTLHCIAKDVKIQVEFNPAKVAGYRLLGYENRMLAAQDFADDAKDAGEIGAGHAVTAFYEVVPAGETVPGAAVDELRYQRPGTPTGNDETLVVKLRWKEPEGQVSTPREFPFSDAGLAFDAVPEDFRFAAAVAAFGMVLRDSKCAGSASLPMVREIAAGALGADAGGWRAEFLSLVDKAATLRK
jgi:Ca-activated chloride channel family protein